MESPKIFSKGAYTIIWCIPNHPFVVSNADSLSQAYMELGLLTRKGIFYDGLIGYRLVDSGAISPYLKLTKRNPREIPCGDLTFVSWSMSQNRPSESDDNWVPLTELPVETSMTDNLDWVHPDIQFRLDPADPRLQNLQADQSLEYELVIDLTEVCGTLPHNQFTRAFSASHKEQWAQCLKKADPTNTDLKIFCNDGVELYAHQLVVCAQNEVFAAEMKQDSMAEGKHGVIKLQEINSSTMKILLHFFYTGELHEEEWMKPENILDFTFAAGKYMLKDVLAMLDARLGWTSHGENNVKLMSLATELGLKNAEVRLVNRVKKMVEKADGGKGILDILGVSYRLMPE